MELIEMTKLGDLFTSSWYIGKIVKHRKLRKDSIISKFIRSKFTKENKKTRM